MSDLLYGRVVGQFSKAIVDGSDPDTNPDIVPSSGTISFIPTTKTRRHYTFNNHLAMIDTIVAHLDDSGSIVDSSEATGQTLLVGEYYVKYNLDTHRIKGHSVVVSDGVDVDLTTASGSGGKFDPSMLTDILRRLLNLENRETISVVSWGDVQDKPTAFSPSSHASAHKPGGSDPLKASDFGAALTTDLSSHISDTLDVHGIVDTSKLIREGDSRLTDARTPKPHTSASVTDFKEAVQDALATFFHITGGTINYDDANNQMTIDIPPGSAPADPEQMRDVIGAALLGVGHISVVVNDDNDTITFTTDATKNDTDAALRDRSTHTGEQPIDSITNLEAVLAQKQPSGNYASAAQGNKADSAVQPDDLATVATTGAYSDLSDKPNPVEFTPFVGASQQVALYPKPPTSPTFPSSEILRYIHEFIPAHTGSLAPRNAKAVNFNPELMNDFYIQIYDQDPQTAPDYIEPQGSAYFWSGSAILEGFLGVVEGQTYYAAFVCGGNEYNYPLNAIIDIGPMLDAINGLGKKSYALQVADDQYTLIESTLTNADPRYLSRSDRIPVQSLGVESLVKDFLYATSREEMAMSLGAASQEHTHKPMATFPFTESLLLNTAGPHTLKIWDWDKLIVVNSPNPVTVRVGSMEPVISLMPATIFVKGSGQLTLEALSGITLNSASGFKSKGAGSVIKVNWVSENEAYISGDLVP